MVTSHSMTVPLDWTKPDDGRTIIVRLREVVAVENADDNLPPVCYFRGGPGFESPAPTKRDGWLDEMTQRYRVFLLDQRGTGRSTPVDAAMADQSPEELAEYLTHFRADSIVRDAEHARHTIVGPDTKWTLQGQSFGGWCILDYLSKFPNAVEGAVITGGFAPVFHPAISVYRALRERVYERNQRYFELFPDDRQIVADVVAHLKTSDVRVSVDWRLTAEQFLANGTAFGTKHGYATIHEVVQRCGSDLESLGTLSTWAKSKAADALGLQANPIYGLLHEAIYCSEDSSDWAAVTALTEDPRFNDPDAPLFTGEMIMPGMFDELPQLRPFKAAADMLAAKADWPALYNIEQLRNNTVPVVGTIYYNDLYVDRTFAIETANLLGNCEFWVTNEYEHGGYSDDPKRVLGRLYSMLDDKLNASH